VTDAHAAISSLQSARYHWTYLALACGAIALSFLLDIDAQGIRVGDSLRLPGTCTSRELLDLPCPGCGLTRSFVSLAHGDWAGAWRYHRVGFAMFILVLLQLPYRAWRLRRVWPLTRNQVWMLRTVGYLMIALLMGNWLWNLRVGWGGLA